MPKKAKKTLLAGIGIAFLAAPLVSSALSVGDLQTQIASLLSRIESLQASTSVFASGSSSLTGSVASPVCPNFVRSLSVGATGSDVTALQQFLSSQGFLNVSATGYFGVLTRAAVANWQAHNGVAASGSAGLGIFGPLSRSFLAKRCAGATSPSGVNFTASPASGPAPLTVQFNSNAPQGTSIGTSVNFGDGSSANLLAVPTCSSCNAEGIVSHTYTSPGTYTATLTGGSCSCPANGICNCPNMAILATATVTVGSSSGGIPTSAIEQLNAPGTVTLSQGGIAEIRNENFYFTLQSLSGSSATIQTTPVGCWNSFPSDPPPQIRCMIAVVAVPPQTLSIGQTYATANYGILLTQIQNGTATFSIQQ
jgi:peptidoglycan hydrolase-like protein with peptidoglycan-binding domain